MYITRKNQLLLEIFAKEVASVNEGRLFKKIGIGDWLKNLHPYLKFVGKVLAMLP
jgi:hypothetical protein